MRPVVVQAAIAAAALTLAACERPPARTAPAAKGAAPATGAAAEANAERRPGLWEQRVSAEGQLVQVSRVCLDQATDRQLSLFGRQMNENLCETHLMTRQPNGAWRINTVCDMGTGGRVTTTGMATGDFSRSYQIRFETETTGAAVPQMNGRRRLVVDAAHRGPCPAGMTPGDMELPGGQRVRALDISRPPAASG